MAQQAIEEPLIVCDEDRRFLVAEPQRLGRGWKAPDEQRLRRGTLGDRGSSRPLDVEAKKV